MHSEILYAKDRERTALSPFLREGARGMGRLQLGAESTDDDRD